MHLRIWTMAAAAVMAASAAHARSPAPAPVAQDLEVFARPQRLVVLPDGRRMNLYCTGQGAPIVIAEGGWTQTTVSWRKVQPDVARFTRICTYDRAGYGFSDPGPLPRTASAIADDLAAMLKAAKIRGPYVIAAHSLGGLDARLFVDRNRAQVAGLVLIEASTETQNRRMAEASASFTANNDGFVAMVKTCAEHVINGTMRDDTKGRGICINPPARSLPDSLNTQRAQLQKTAGYQRSALSELASFDISAEQVAKSRRSYGDLPLVVLTGESSQDDPELPAAEREALRKTWWAIQADAASLSTRGRHQLVPEASHFILNEKPQAAVDAIREVVEAARSRLARPAG